MIAFPDAISRLESHYGKPEIPRLKDPLEAILYENVLYLADDAKREKAFAALWRLIGGDAAKLVSLPDAKLLAICKSGGILPDTQLAKLRKIGEITMKRFGGDLRPILHMPIPQAKKALRLFPAIGEPSAEKILMLAGVEPVLALDSNGLRVLLRLGFAEESGSYATSYKDVQEAAMEQNPGADAGFFARGHVLLRRHGKELCKRTKPFCARCPLAEDCAFFLGSVP